MKRRIALLMGMSMVMVSLVVGCGKEETDGDSKDADVVVEENADQGNDGNDAAPSTTGYVFKASGVEISVDADMAPIAEALGEPDSIFEEPSCAAEGIAKLYTYPGYEINTYPDGDNDLVGTIVLKDDTVATLEGIDLSMTKADVIDVYGDGYAELEGQIVYEKDGMKLHFILDGDNLASIEYSSAVMD